MESGQPALDLRVQKVVTFYLLTIYSVMMLTFVAGLILIVVWGAGEILDMSPPLELPTWIAAAVAWMEGILGSQIGTLTGQVKDAVQFWLGSSFGSKTKDNRPAPPGA